MRLGFYEKQNELWCDLCVVCDVDGQVEDKGGNIIITITITIWII